MRTITRTDAARRLLMQHDRAPKVVLAALLVAWLAVGLWAVAAAPFASGTDESISFVAFAAAKNRWATEADFRRYGIDHFYYPPLYYLLFAPFWGDDPVLTEDYPRRESLDANYLNRAGRRVTSAAYAASVPPQLERLYRAAKLVSLALGFATLLALVGTLRLLFAGSPGWWPVLLGVTPVVLLPQFLYYHTLVNNDSLLNALGAASCLAFVAAILSLERGDDRRFIRLGFAVAACTGLAFLTKMSAPVLLPLLPGLAWARCQSDRSVPVRLRVRRALALLAILAGVAFACGGWWIAYKAGIGDWNSFKAHRLAHPWAESRVVGVGTASWWLDQVLLIVRSYYALFSGALAINAPDATILAWLLAPAAVGACAAVAVVRWFGGVGQPPSRSTGLRVVVWWTFAAVVLLNIGSVMTNLLLFNAPFGRLLFPSLVASHTLAVLAITRVVGARPRVVIAFTLLLVLHGVVLFGATLRDPMAAAIAQPPEDVRILTGADEEKLAGPVWTCRAEQRIWLAAGEVVALRIRIHRSSQVPQLGAAVAGTLTLWPGTASAWQVPVRRLSLGDGGAGFCWDELRLEVPARLERPTPALLSLRGEPPAWPRGGVGYSYSCGKGGEPASFNKQNHGCSLRLAAVYRPEAVPDATQGGR